MKLNLKTSAAILAYYRQISTETFNVVDLETTGGLGSRDRIMEISIVRATLKDGIQQISTDFIDPQIQIPDQIVRFTGITQDMVSAANPSNLVLPNYLPLLQTGILTAHNLKFDYSFLQTEYRRLGTTFTADPTVCTLELSRILLSHLPSRSLPNLVNHFGFKVGKSHRAESDAIACWLLLEQLLLQMQKSEDEEILNSIQQEWLTLKEIKAIAQLPTSKVKSLLTDASIKSQFSHSRKIYVYERASVENLIQNLRKGEGEQLCLPL
jgi:DNA polymerase III subunit epsilon